MSTHQAAIDRQLLANSLLRCGPWTCTHDDDALCDHARAQARAVAQDAAYLGQPRRAMEKAITRAERHGIEPPEGYGIAGTLGRLSCELWWRRKLRRINSRRLEQRQRILGRVHLRDGIYISQEGLQRRREQNVRNAMLLEAMTATNQEGQEYTLAELSELGLANPNNRRAELMLRIRDTENEARRLGHVGMFYTITCPSRFHPVKARPFRINTKYDGSTPREAQAHLQGQWAKARAKLKRLGRGIYGIRVVEPHHDGTPHWHLLLWMKPEDVGAVTSELREYAFEVDRHELTTKEARKARFDAKAIDYSRGTAAGYVAKYISKNINGEQFSRGNIVGDNLDKYGHPLEASAPRIEAWASCWGIRQFQFVGLPSVTVWRELRRIREAELLDAWEQERNPEPEAAAILAEIRQYADAGQWDKWLRAMGGPMTPRAEQPVKPWAITRRASRLNEETGEEITEQRNRYGEPLQSILGVIVQSDLGEPAECLTRFYRWDVAPKGQKSGFDFERSGAADSPRTHVNNCTPPAKPRENPDPRTVYEPWELNATDWFRRMNPAPDPQQVEKLRADTAIAANRFAIESEERRQAKQAERDRTRQLREAENTVIRWLANDEITIQEAAEVLTA